MTDLIPRYNVYTTGLDGRFDVANLVRFHEAIDRAAEILNRSSEEILDRYEVMGWSNSRCISNDGDRIPATMTMWIEQVA